MSKLSDETLTEEEMTNWFELIRSFSSDHLGRAHEMLYSAIAEIRRHRSALAADRERVIDIVEEAIDRSRDLPIGRAERAIATRVAEQLATAGVTWAPNKEHVRTIVDNAVIDVASVGPPLKSTNLRMMSAAIADRVADALAPSPSESEPVDDESDYEKRNRELHRLGRLSGKP